MGAGAVYEGALPPFKGDIVSQSKLADMDRRRIEPEGIAFTACIAKIEATFKRGEKAMREYLRVNMTFNGRHRRPLRFDGEQFFVEYEEIGAVSATMPRMVRSTAEESYNA